MDINKIISMPHTLKSLLSIYLFLCVCIISACTSDAEETQVLEAAREYAKQNTDVAVNVQAESILEDYARVRVIPKNPGEADEALMYLKKEKDKWKGISMGTGFSPDDFEALGIPEKIR
jgi:hypothetical protein